MFLYRMLGELIGNSLRRQKSTKNYGIKLFRNFRSNSQGTAYAHEQTQPLHQGSGLYGILFSVEIRYEPLSFRSREEAVFLNMRLCAFSLFCDRRISNLTGRHWIQLSEYVGRRTTYKATQCRTTMKSFPTSTKLTSAVRTATVQ